MVLATPPKESVYQTHFLVVDFVKKKKTNFLFCSVLRHFFYAIIIAANTVSTNPRPVIASCAP